MCVCVCVCVRVRVCISRTLPCTNESGVTTLPAGGGGRWRRGLGGDYDILTL